MQLRHIILTTTKGMITELEKVGVTPQNGKQYVFRCRKAPQISDVIFDTESSDGSSAKRKRGGAQPQEWTGFRYRDAHWSFINRIAASQGRSSCCS